MSRPVPDEDKEAHKSQKPSPVTGKIILKVEKEFFLNNNLIVSFFSSIFDMHFLFNYYLPSLPPTVLIIT